MGFINFLRYDLIVGIKNLIRWFHVIFYDRDWDSLFIFEILKKKLEFQAKYFEKNGDDPITLRKAQQVNVCIELIKRLNEDYYTTEIFNYFESKFEQTGNRLKLKYKDINIADYFNKYRRICRILGIKNKEGEIKDLVSEALIVAGHNRERAKRLLFDLLHNYIENWWD